MHVIPPSQIAALADAAADSLGQLRRTRGPRGAGYRNDQPGAVLHSPIACCALARDGFLAEHSPGFQAVFVITEAGRRTVDANQRAHQVARSSDRQVRA